MNYNLWQRWLNWICDTFGHNLDTKEEWEFDNQIHAHCKRCGFIISKDK